MALSGGSGEFDSGNLSLLKGVWPMDINLIFKIAGIGLLVSIIHIVLTQAEREEQAQLLTIVGVIVVMMMVLRLLRDLFADITTIFGF